jgi:hypothetical protein
MMDRGSTVPPKSSKILSEGYISSRSVVICFMLLVAQTI